MLKGYSMDDVCNYLVLTVRCNARETSVNVEYIYVRSTLPDFT